MDEMSGDVETADRILRAAIVAFGDHGYSGASIARIADEAETSKSLVLYHFPNKRRLAAAVVASAYVDGVFLGGADVPGEPLSTLEAAAAHLVDRITHDPLGRVAVALHPVVGSLARHSMIDGWLARTAALLRHASERELLLPGADLASETRVLVGSCAGLVGLAMASGDYRALEKDVESVVRARIDGFRR